MVKVTKFRMSHLAAMRMAAYERKIPVLKSRQAQRFVADLQALHDALEHSPLNGHYWVWSGLLLGWAREGAILQHDTLDADFAVADEDFARLIGAIPAILAAGFVRDRCFVNNDGVVTELTFLRHGARFDFFRMFRETDHRRHYFMYSIRLSGITQIEAVLPDQAKVPLEFLQRTWLKPQDHELELASMYGNWEIPDPSWSYVDGIDVVRRVPSRHSHFDWRSDAVFRSPGPTAAAVRGRSSLCPGRLLAAGIRGCL